MKETLERRLDFLTLEAEGFSLVEIVKELSAKYHKRERTIYYDAETRSTWQPLYVQYFDLDKARLTVMNRYGYIYREAVFNYKQGDPAHKPTYLKLMLEVTNNLIELLGLQSLRDVQDREQRAEESKRDCKRLEPLLELALKQGKHNG